MANRAKAEIIRPVSAAKEAALEVRDVHVHYGSIHALKGVTLTVYEGEIVALIGANGAGKTTLLKAISGILIPTEGEIQIRGVTLPAGRPRAAVLAGIAHVPEGRGIFGNLTVHENLELGAYLRRDRRAVAADEAHVFELFPVLRDRKKQLAGTLSGGEQQMLAIGRGLMMRPNVLLLDEPSLGLAPILVRKIFQIVTEINRQGTTILLVEQNARLALQTAHRGYVVDTGEIVLENSAPALLRDENVRKAYLGEV